MMNNLNGNTFRKIAFIGNYVPRQCGIATFTTDLCEAMAAGYPETEFFAIAMNDRACGYDYPARVRFEIQQDELPMYHSAADFLEIFDVDLVCLQHEFGIFGGRAGRHVLALLEDLHIPIVTTLHTVLAKPDVEQKSVMDRLIQLSDRMVVMSRRGSGYLQEIYGLPEERIDLIPHGIHDVPFMDPNFYKDRFQVEGKKVLLTFGLVSPNKGIEYGIQALPEILKHIPDFVYIILGATHPNIKRDDGEQYRHSLEQLAVDLGVSENVQFHDRYVSLDELIQYIGAADVYLTPYLNPAQIVSGTLAYSAGAGKAVISTPYWYAEELLADGRGEIVPFRDSQAIAKVVVDLFHNEMQRHAMRKRAYLYTRDMIWPKIAQDYMDSFTRAISGRTDSPKNTRSYALIHQMENGESLDRLPPLNLNHLKRMTDDTGILQHAIFDLPNYREGYTTDDNARALLLTLLFSRMNRDNEAAVELSELSARYLAFLWYAFDEQRGRFHNFMGFNRSWLDEVGSEDSSCRTIWSLGAVLGQSEDENLVGAAARLFHQALPAVLDFSSPRAWSYALLGIHEYLRRYPGDRAALSTGKSLAWKLADLYRDTCGPGWHWFEDTLAYDNAVLPHALYCFSQQLADPEIHQISLDALHWLLEVQSGPDGCFCPIGSQGFYQRDGTRARFDQQPIEAWATVSACLEVYRSTGEAFWLQEAQRAFSWFLGRNDLGQSLYDVHTGGCRDGLHPERMNHNQGAESTLGFLTSLAEMHLVQTSLVPRHEVRHLSQALSAPPALGD